MRIKAMRISKCATIFEDNEGWMGGESFLFLVPGINKFLSLYCHIVPFFDNLRSP